MSQSAQHTGFWQSIKGLPGRTPLRVKLITALLVLVALALAVISVAGITILRDNLLAPYDNALASDFNRPNFVGSLLDPYFQTHKALRGQQFAAYWIPAGGSVHEVVVPYANQLSPSGIQGLPGPSRPMSGPDILSGSHWIAPNLNHPFILGALNGSGRWRVLAETVPLNNGSNGILVLAYNVSSVYTTIGQLAAIDLIISVIVVALLAGLAVALIRASLRPLVDIEKTAGAIAAGDLSRRVPERDPRTEVGRLGRSLNVMLSQIETAFRARSQSEAAARRSEEKMRQFVADASHELRTPLTAIRGFAEYYRQRGGIEEGRGSEAADVRGTEAAAGSVDEPATSPGNGSGREAPAEVVAAASNGTGKLASADLDRIMRRVEQESSRMGVLVEDMLLLARLDQQRPLDYRPVDLLTLAADAVHDARVVAPSRSINLTVGSGAALLVIGDEVRLRQVIGNLMSNAMSHTPDGTPIDVLIRSGNLDEAPTASSAEQADQPGQPNPRPAAVLEVADQGPGLTKEQAEHVFERFYRADQARTSGGTGLGLAIVAALVKAHDGAAWVRSQPGSGATFCIALPLAPEAAQGANEDHDAGEEAEPTDVDTAEQQTAAPRPAGKETGGTLLA